MSEFGAEWVKPGRQRHDDVIPVALRQTSVDPFAAGAAQVEFAEPMGEVAEPPGEGDDEYGGMGDQAGGAVAPEAEADDAFSAQLEEASSSYCNSDDQERVKVRDVARIRKSRGFCYLLT